MRGGRALRTPPETTAVNDEHDEVTRDVAASRFGDGASGGRVPRPSSLPAVRSPVTSTSQRRTTTVGRASLAIGRPGRFAATVDRPPPSIGRHGRWGHSRSMGAFTIDGGLRGRFAVTIEWPSRFVDRHNPSVVAIDRPSRPVGHGHGGPTSGRS